jgi:hypothetical protein
MLVLVGIGNPLGTRNLYGYGFGQNFIPVMGMDFLADVFFIRGYGIWTSNTPRVFIRCPL